MVCLTVACDVGEVAEAAIPHARKLIDCTVLAKFYATQFSTVLNAIVLTYVGELEVKPGDDPSEPKGEGVFQYYFHALSSWLIRGKASM
jgi:hypothetical protein